MSKCEAIYGLKFDEKSQNTLQRINDKKIYGNLLAGALSAGVFFNIFTKSNSAQVSYNILQTDWNLYFNAMKSVPEITKRAIEKEIEYMIIHYQLQYDDKHLKFWEGIYSGCK